ncbi:hypothetical protein [Pelistega europaea]|uniref:Uncharacterized protein n=1 Tax=Pelistega europaea TaxID=106147 RepID=A0A7Y4LD13_9BURK|nr:hypothetical protein [Pelistega europaea]NOL49991.1 hypothetical protein [Pelistega europaea]
MKLLNRLRHEFSGQVAARAVKQSGAKKPSKAALALLPKLVPEATLKASLR